MVRNAHQTLKWILDLKETIGILARWRLRLMKFDFEVIHRPKEFAEEPDTLPRLLTTNVYDAKIDAKIDASNVAEV